MSEETISPTNSIYLFDDLLSCYHSLLDDTCEQAFLKYIGNQEIINLNHAESVNECRRLQDKLNTCLKDISTLHSKLKAARKVLDIERKKRRKLEIERNSYIEKFSNLGEIFYSKPDHQLNTNIVIEAFRCNSESGKKMKLCGDSSSMTSDTTISEEELNEVTMHCQNYKKHRVFEDDEILIKRPKTLVFDDQNDDRHKSMMFDEKNSNKENLNDRQHDFVGKSVIMSKSCVSCQKKLHIGKMIYKCVKCHAMSHFGCREDVPLPCVENSIIMKKGFKGTISDHAPSNHHKVPAVIIHCIDKIERTGLKELGLYRVSGNEKEIRALKEKLKKGRGLPSLEDIDVHTVCGYLKDFLRNLDDTLIPNVERNLFIKAVIEGDESDLKRLIKSLPEANKHTLAFLILHLQRVSFKNSENRMNIQNLATVFAPTLVGYSQVEPLNLIISESQESISVMMKLLELSSEFWGDLLSHSEVKEKNCENILSDGLKKPRKLFLTPRSKRRFFASPM